MPVGSAQGGRILTPDAWRQQNKGYLYGSDCSRHSDYKLARQYVKEKNFCDDSLFDHSLDCYYHENNCHIEIRGGHRYLRPSLCSKMVFRNSRAVFNDSSWLYSYHGTDPKNVKSILENGLTYPGYSKGIGVSTAHGGAYGQGVYTSKLPLYAQLYAKCEKWKGKYVQTIFLVRQDPRSISVHGGEGCFTTSMIGRTDLHRLYGEHIKSNEIQFVTTKVDDNNIIQGLLIKIHETKPDQAGGEYYEVSKLLDSI